MLDDELEAGALRLVPLPLAGAALGLVLDLVLPMSVLYLSARYFSVFFSVAVTLPPSFDEASSFLTSAALSLPPLASESPSSSRARSYLTPSTSLK